MQKVPFSVDARGKLEKLKMPCFIKHSGGSVQGKATFWNMYAKKEMIIWTVQCVSCTRSAHAPCFLVEKGVGVPVGTKGTQKWRFQGVCVGAEVAQPQLPGHGMEVVPSPGTPPAPRGCSVLSQGWSFWCPWTTTDPVIAEMPLTFNPPFILSSDLNNNNEINPDLSVQGGFHSLCHKPVLQPWCIWMVPSSDFWGRIPGTHMDRVVCDLQSCG